MDSEQLRKFLLAAHQSGYAKNGEEFAKKAKDVSKSLFFEQGDLMAHDRWYGGEPYGGTTTVFYQKQPIWMMVYYGSVDPAFENFKEVYAFLRKAFLNTPKEFPLRGPKKFSEGKWRYQNNWQGHLGIYSGEEAIFYDKKSIYLATYAGGFVDQRKE
jgi:hypothetical protein